MLFGRIPGVRRSRSGRLVADSCRDGGGHGRHRRRDGRHRTLGSCRGALGPGAQPHPARTPAPVGPHRLVRARDGRASRRPPGAGQPAAVLRARGPARDLRPVRRHARPRGPVAGAAADDAQHGAPAGRRRRADAAPVHPADPRARAQGQPDGAAGHRRRPRRVRRWLCERRCPMARCRSRSSARRSTEAFPGVPANALGPPGPGRGAARPAATARLLEAAGRRGLPVRRHLVGASARRARPAGHRAALPRGVRSRVGRRRHRLVRRARHPRRARLDGRPGPPHRRRGQEARRPALRRHRRPRHPRARSAARPLRQRLALPRRP